MSKSIKKVDDTLVNEVHLLVPIHWLWRWDLAPFVLIYCILFYKLYNADIYNRYYQGTANPGAGNVGWMEIDDADLTSVQVQIALVGIPVVLFLQLIVFLLSQWSMTIKCRLGYRHVSSVDDAVFVLVVASRNAGQDRMVPLLRVPDNLLPLTKRRLSIAGCSFGVQPIRFEFQKSVYEFDADKNTFVRLAYPVMGSVKHLLAHRGMTTVGDADLAGMKWGANVFDIPVPAFLDLYAEHLTAPFFVFQVLCLFLWSLDDYWYYSVFTLVMLMIFEGVLCKRRQGGIRVLRAMRRQPVGMQVFRNGAWEYLSSEALVPGDIIALTTNEILTKPMKKKTGGSSDKEFIVPVDALLLRGSCVVNEAMLTGESVPQIKESLRNVQDPQSFLDLKAEQHGDAEWRRHLVFSGTALVQDSDGLQDEASSTPADGCTLPTPPCLGCIALVIRTGFGTTQGSLMRKILFATERVSANNTETAQFIAVLVLFAIAASATVLHVGLQDESRNKFKLFLHCIMIVTSVVPPELPMELTLAVTNSLNALSKQLVFCTEPFRLPLAGKLDILCFDKTGTLTKDRMLLRGVVAQQDVPMIGSERRRAEGSDLPGADFDDTFTPLSEDSEGGKAYLCVLSIMASCNSLFKNKGEIQGDPLESTTLRASGFVPTLEEGASSAIGGLGDLVHVAKGIRIVRRHLFPFSSSLKRMSVIASISPVDSTESTSSSGSGGAMWVLTKGAPEVLADMLVSVPAQYHQVYRSCMNSGKRVLALACKKVLISSQNLRQYLRAEAEKDLIFVGFLVYDCDLKPDTESVIQELHKSGHRVVMITGDSAYTAADIGRRLSILRLRKTLMLQTLTSGKLVWRDALFSAGDGTTSLDTDFDPKTCATIAKEYNLLVDGNAFASISLNPADRPNILKELCPHVSIFARVSPVQKEEVLLSMNEAGMYSLMCGDGTNDVGALKAAHVGVSIVNDPDFEGRVEKSAKLALAAGSSREASSSRTLQKKSTMRGDRMSRALAELEEQEADPTLVKLGDASIASPFTARRTSIDSVLAVIRQGRCTLVTTIQVFKILALNCLVSAYMMSALYLRGLKNGDIQMTASGVVSAGLFFFLSLATPLSRIAPTKPPSSVFTLSISLSIVGQFAVHMCCLLYTLHICEEHVVHNDVTMTADGKFFPNIINSAVFLLTAVMQVNNFVVNYRGHPYTESISENKLLWRTVMIIYFILLLVAGGQFEPLNDLLQMAPFPNPTFQATLLAVLLSNFVASYSIEKLCQKFE